MQWISQILFALCLGAGIWFFAGRVRFIRRNILLGKDVDLSDNPAARWKQMFWVAMGQSKMAKRPVAFVFHLFVYLGFVLINIEVLEILLDGLLGTHRLFSFMGGLYNAAIGFFEILALLVLVACVVFLARRFVVKVPRLNAPELKGWPVKDATTILIVEIVLMAALLKMNAADQILQSRGAEHYTQAGSFPVSQYLVPLMDGFSTDFLVIAERGAWWFHFIGILLFLNYVPYSKHWHIIMSFPNVYYTPLKPKGAFANMESVTTEVKLMMDPSATPPEGYEPPAGFGARDVQDLTWKNLMDAYTCTECGRCSSVCPANLTGKKLSPRKIMMDTRDRLEEVGRNLDAGTTDDKDLHSYISAEELWACTTCNACAEACPVNINPVDIIVQMRQYQVMEKSAAPTELNNMFTNLENNGAPWQMSQMDKANWTQS
ncbi:MAG: 4Fe-4S dicluster domain-containing protein [Sphingomonadales bacterium]|jgi:heterodisulfide reductase subunit C